MSRDSPQDLPPDLRRAIKQAPSDNSTGEDGPDLEALWALLGSATPASSDLPEASETWAGVRRHIESEAEASGDAPGAAEDRAARPPQSKASHRSAWRWGAVALVVLAVGLGAWLWHRPVVVTATPGTSVTHSLPDGSTAELNGGTRLSYSRTMETVALLEDARRGVRVQGEAYFEVRSAERPFVVRTAAARIQVVGTAFAVQTDEERDRTHVALAEGAVRVEGRSAPDRAVTLQPGEAVQVDVDGPTAAPSDTSFHRVVAWRRGGFAVTAQPLPAIAQVLERQFGTPVRLSPAIPDEVTSSPLTLYYSQDVDVETILHDLSMLRNLSYRPSTNGYVLEPAGKSRSPSK